MVDLGYAKKMKTAISLPDNIYYEVEATAHSMGIPRSVLYVNALEEYLQKNNRKNITQKLNEVYTDDYDKEFEPISNAALASIRELTKDDTW
jgi:metal-responsive CopG/Arc/MetJ family transcriptional regulator